MAATSARLTTGLAEMADGDLGCPWHLCHHQPYNR
jgi:hypothetical protein